MGNCIDRQQAVSWVDDYDEDWSSEESVSPANHHNNKSKYPKMPSTGEEGVPSTEVKIRITKQQLATLMKQVDGKDLTVQEVLADLMSGRGTRFEEDAGRHWKPALQSIPEASEQQQ